MIAAIVTFEWVCQEARPLLAGSGTSCRRSRSVGCFHRLHTSLSRKIQILHCLSRIVYFQRVKCDNGVRQHWYCKRRVLRIGFEWRSWFKTPRVTSIARKSSLSKPKTWLASYSLLSSSFNRIHTFSMPNSRSLTILIASSRPHYYALNCAGPISSRLQWFLTPKDIC